jgi:starch-binding outer membrane protein, SusD/RagB family
MVTLWFNPKYNYMFNYKIVLFVFASLAVLSCKKTWMEEKSDKTLDVPTTVTAYQALLDHTGTMNDGRPPLGEESADNYYITNNMFAGYIPSDRNIYLWEKEIFVDKDFDINWNSSYKQAFQTNIVLDGINDVAAEDVGTPAWNNVKGSAHFFRAEAYFNVAQLFAKPYSLTFPDEPGIPLRLTPDPKVQSVRAGLHETYEQILSDLHTAAGYLPVAPQYKTRPSKPAAYALLSRVYLAMQDYSHALSYADSCLKLYDSLFNTIITTPTYPIASLNKEVILHATMLNYFQARGVIVDTNLYKSYKVNDLRRTVFFKTNTNGGMRFVGTYTGGNTGFIFFSGIATDEVFLTRAECYARAGNITAAMNDLNTLMIKRWKTGAFVPFAASTTSEALGLILEERRKETLFRGLRWTDLRRLNSEGANIVLTRVVNGQTYTLPPNSPRYTLPLSPEVINLTGMPQNER